MNEKQSLKKVGGNVSIIDHRSLPIENINTDILMRIIMFYDVSLALVNVLHMCWFLFYLLQ